MVDRREENRIEVKYMNEIDEMTEEVFGGRDKLPNCAERVAYQLVPNHLWILCAASLKEDGPTHDQCLEIARTPRPYREKLKGLELVCTFDIQPRHDLEPSPLASLFG